MFKSALLAGFFWATSNFMPSLPVTSPAAVPAVKAPVLMAAVLAPSTPLTLETSALPTPTAQSAGVETGDQEQQQVQDFLERINSERTSRGLSPLTLDPMLGQTAHAHSEEMCRQNYFNHHSPTPGLATPMDRYLTSLKSIGEAQPDYLLVGENIYYCSVYNDVYNTEYAHHALMNSPGHRANILEPRFTKIGLGIYRSARGEFWITEMFSRDTNP